MKIKFPKLRQNRWHKDKKIYENKVPKTKAKQMTIYCKYKAHIYL